MIHLSPRQRKISKTISWVLLILFIVLLIIMKVIPYIAPFIMALFITFMIERPVRFLIKKTKISRGVSVAVVLLVFVLVVGGILTLVFSQIINEIWKLTKEIPSAQTVKKYVEMLLEKSQALYLSLPSDFEKALRDNLGSLVGTVSSYLESLLNYMVNIVKFLPQFFVFIVISLVASFFMSRDREKISNFVFKQIPEGWKNKIRTVKDDLFVALVGYIKAQFILITITFIELLIGYGIIGVKYAFFFAVITAIVDALPILGTGTILIPTSAIYLLLGNIPRAFAFIVLYIIISVVRQFLEPKVVGENLGLHPLVTLISIYVGMQIFGIIGLFLGPILVIIFKALQKARILPQWKT